MISLGISRNIDKLGRIVIPKKLRKNMDIDMNTNLEIYIDHNDIILKKSEPACAFCGEIKSGNFLFKEKIICLDCVKEINQKVKRG